MEGKQQNFRNCQKQIWISSLLAPNLFLLNTGAVFCFETRAKDEELWKYYWPCRTEKKIELQAI